MESNVLAKGESGWRREFFESRKNVRRSERIAEGEG